MANMIKFYRGLVNSLPAAGELGALYVTTDEGAIYYGTGEGMKRLGDFIVVADVASLPADGAHETCMYYCESENVLAKWDSSKAEWVQINKQPTAAQIKTMIGLSDYETKTDASAKLTAANTYTDNEVAKVQKEVDDLEAYIGVIPESYDQETVIAYVNKKAEETLAAAQGGSSETAASVKLALDNYKAENDVAVAANAEAIETLEEASATHALKTEVEAVDDKVDDLAGKVGEVGEGKTVVGMIGDVQGNVDTLTDKVGEVPADKTVVQMIADAQTAATYDDTKVKADIEANSEAIGVIEADYLKAADKTELQGNIDTLTGVVEALRDGVDAEKVDGVIDLINYVEAHGPEVTEMQEAIAANEEAIKNMETAAAEAYETKSDANNKLTEAKGYADDLDAAMNTRVEALEAIDHEHANKALLDTYTQTEDDLADAVSKKHAHANATELDKIADGDVAKWNAAQANAEATAAAALADARTEISAEIDADVKVVSDALAEYTTANDATVATKANAADVYAKTETYTQAEVDAAIEEAVQDACSWGEF